MKSKYIIQIKRNYFWEDIFSLRDKVQALSYLDRLRNEGLMVRLLEVIVL